MTVITATAPSTSLVKLLEIKRKLVQPDEEMSLLLADRLWREVGCPCEVQELSRTLDRVLQLCVREAILYAPVLLLRKKSLDRGTWKPMPLRASPAPAIGPRSAASPNAAASRDTAAPHTASPSNGSCVKCNDTGHYTSPDGMTGYLCPCGAYLRNLKLQRGF